MELKVNVININTETAHELLSKCDILREYSIFVETIRKYKKEKDAIKRAIYECIEKGILSEYLKRKGSEVRNMLMAEYSYEKDIQIKQEEARLEGEKRGEERGEQRGEKKGLQLSMRIIQALKEYPLDSDEQIAKRIDCAPDIIKYIRKSLNL